MIDIQNESIVSLDEVAGHFHVSLQTVRNWANSRGSRRLETIRVGRLIRTSWEAVQRFAVQLDDAQTTSAVESIKRPTTSPTHDESVRWLRSRGLKF